MELQQRTGNGGHRDDDPVYSAPNDAYGALDGGEIWSGIIAERLSARQLILHHVGLRLFVYKYVYMYVTLDPRGHGGG